MLVLERFPGDGLLQRIAAENNLAETAFLVPDAGDFRLRWFTPKLEVPLCGHATLASAAVVLQRLEPSRSSVVFHTASGALPVVRAGAGFMMNFPARPAESVAAPSGLVEALGLAPLEVFENAFNYLALYEDHSHVRQLTPDLVALAKLNRPGVIVSAPGGGPYDFVSRYFAPAKGIPEDPVTGAAHCMLAPVWAKRLGKTSFRAFQASARGGELACRLLDDRVELEGECVFFVEGTAEVDAD